MLTVRNSPYNFYSTNNNSKKANNLATNSNSSIGYKSLYTDLKINKNNSCVFFSGLQISEPANRDDVVNKTGEYQCDTSFFRDMETLKLMKDYLKTNFPQGTHIADFGCSNGEETRTISMILSDINQENRYTITGYDPSENRINEANEGEYKAGKTTDAFLSTTKSLLTPKAQKLKKLFDEYFKDKEINYGDEKSFKAKDDKFKCINGFDIGNINDVDEILKDKKTGAIVFKNAWYHITQANTGGLDVAEDYNDLSDLKKVLNKIHKVLPENGILVTGSLPRDHIRSNFMSNYSFHKGVIENSPFHKALKACGFEPVKESAVKIPHEYLWGFFFPEDISLYSIWKKAE